MQPITTFTVAHNKETIHTLVNLKYPMDVWQVASFQAVAIGQRLLTGKRETYTLLWETITNRKLLTIHKVKPITEMLKECTITS